MRVTSQPTLSVHDPEDSSEAPLPQGGGVDGCDDWPSSWSSRWDFVLVGAQASLAASPHFKHGGEPTCTITPVSASSDSITCTATLAGLGNDDVVVTTSVSGTAVYQCQNNGGNTAPGQNKVLVGPATSTTSIPADQIKNGNLTFTTNPAVLTAPTTVSGAVAGCPNPNWTGSTLS